MINVRELIIRAHEGDKKPENSLLSITWGLYGAL